MTEQQNSKEQIERRTRYTSHALVEVKKWKWWPFGVASGVLLDMSMDGFKLEFTSEYTAKTLDRLWITLPLGPLGILSPQRLSLPIEVRWFDDRRYRIGGVFLELSEEQKSIVNKVVKSLKDRGLDRV
jgi:hypothetical protein